MMQYCVVAVAADGILLMLLYFLMCLDAIPVEMDLIVLLACLLACTVELPLQKQIKKIIIEEKIYFYDENLPCGTKPGRTRRALRHEPSDRRVAGISYC